MPVDWFLSLAGFYHFSYRLMRHFLYSITFDLYILVHTNKKDFIELINYKMVVVLGIVGTVVFKETHEHW